MIGIGREVTGRRKGGANFPMELAVSAVTIDGVRHFVGITRDITERKKSEKIKAQFISTVSHELRTPLTSIRGALGLILGGASGELPAKAKALVEMASRNSERLTLLINDILDLEKIESGKLSFNLKPVDLGTLSHQALESNQGYAVEHDVRLELKNMISGVMIEADDHRLLQVFANLISNAVKFSPKQGVVEISVTRNNNRVRVSIRDYGPGISEEFESKIFQRFSQADSSDTREKGGTGLGLSITKALVEQHHGQIGYLSPPGGGTEFYFELPELTHVIETSEAQTRATHVLICEDNADVAQVLGSMLAQEGLSYDVAGNAAAAKQLLAKKQYSALLLDLGLPDQNGLELIQELKKDKDTASLPIIVISARADEGRIELNGDGFDVIDWIQKPIDEERLRSALYRVLNSDGNPRVLHVEDSLDVIQIAKEIVGEIAEYEYVTTLKSARSLLNKQTFDLIIIDASLPDGSGLELIPELDAETCVIVFSGNEIDEDIKGQINASLTKATTSNKKLLDTIKRVINDSRRSTNK